MHYAQHPDDPDEEIQAGLCHKIHCNDDDIPYMGFFDKVLRREKPFSMCGQIDFSVY